MNFSVVCVPFNEMVPFIIKKIATPHCIPATLTILEAKVLVIHYYKKVFNALNIMAGRI